MVKSGYGQSGLWTLNLSVWTKLMELTVVLHAGTSSWQLKGDWKFLRWRPWSKMGVTSLVT